MSNERPSTLRWAKVAMAAGALLLAAAAGLLVWDAYSNGEPPDVVITGQTDEITPG